jgi:hypothetical protein
MCAQVAVGWWHGRVDFLHAQQRIMIQVDGSCRDIGMYQSSRQQIVQRDFDFCVAAYDAYMPFGGSVRVRTCESDWCQSLPIGILLATVGSVIVLSPSYSTVMYDKGAAGLQPFPQALAAALQHCSYQVLRDWHVIRRLPHGV